MKLGLCIEMAFASLPFEQRLAAAAKAGFRYVEMWFVDGSFRGTGEELAALAKKHRVKITNTVIGSPDGSIGGGLTDPANRRQWLDRVRMTLAFNQAAGIPATIVCTGNVVPGRSDRQMEKSVLAGLGSHGETGGSGRHHASVGAAEHPLRSSPATGSPAATAARPSAGSSAPIALKLLFDCYHMQIMEGDLLKHVERNLDVIGHIHSAGVPGRHELFQGEVNYPFVFRKIERLGYQGVFGLEYMPSMSDAVSVRKTRKHLGM